MLLGLHNKRVSSEDTLQGLRLACCLSLPNRLLISYFLGCPACQYIKYAARARRTRGAKPIDCYEADVVLRHLFTFFFAVGGCGVRDFPPSPPRTSSYAKLEWLAPWRERSHSPLRHQPKTQTGLWFNRCAKSIHTPGVTQ